MTAPPAAPPPKATSRCWGWPLPQMLIGLVLWIAAVPRYQRITGEFAAPFGALPAPPAPGAPPVSSDRESTDKEQ